MSGLAETTQRLSDHCAEEGLLLIMGVSAHHAVGAFKVDDCFNINEARDIINKQPQDGFHYNVYNDQGRIVPLI